MIGLCLAGAVVFGVWTWMQYRHRFSVSCDDRLDVQPRSRCTDYYGDYGEVSCGMNTMKNTPCNRAGALGGCRHKGYITWYYRGGDVSSEDWRQGCSGSDKPVAADWKEPEE